MMKQLVECVPNVSEGRRAEVVQQIADAVRAVPGAYLLDVESDADHNRSVLTFVGTPEAVAEAAFQVARTAAELINLDEHSGEHPRMGATDVIPFIPLRGVSMEDCVQLARQVGQQLGEELQIPVYLYEEAATRGSRRNLADVRRGQYEGLKEAIGTDPERAPDFGPVQLGAAGATAVGARAPLIAFNVYLNTTDVSVARNIATAIRHSSGGLRFVKALGLEVDGLAQVSMNMTNFQGTPLFRVIEMIRTEAARQGVNVLRSEVVGLVPEDALVDAAIWYLQLHGFEKAQILERRIVEVAGEER